MYIRHQTVAHASVQTGPLHGKGRDSVNPNQRELDRGWVGFASEGEHMMKRRLAVVTSVAAVAVAVGATPAAAHPNHPPHNPAWCGAENMRAATIHMRDAMVLHTAPQGDAGMMGAVENAPC